MAIGFDILVF